MRPGVKRILNRWMRHSEIVNELSIPDTRQDAADILIRAGYKELGTGGFAGVYAKDGSPDCVKLYTTRDRGYSDFLSMVAKNPNLHFPRITGRRRLLGSYYAVRMERLTPAPKEMHPQIEMIDDYIISIKYSDYLDRERIEEVHAYMDAHPDLKEACDLIAQVLRNGGGDYLCDLAPRNVMMRGDTLVITDPIETDDSEW